jgi:hypothetical protein
MFKKFILIILLKIFRRENIFLKFLLILQGSFLTVRSIKRISFKYSIIFIPQIIYSHYFRNENLEKFQKMKKNYILIINIGLAMMTGFLQIFFIGNKS